MLTDALKVSMVKNGASFTGNTVSMKLWESVALVILSLTTTVISVEPFQFSSGVMTSKVSNISAET